jgi:hypothetical protein
LKPKAEWICSWAAVPRMKPICLNSVVERLPIYDVYCRCLTPLDARFCVPVLVIRAIGSITILWCKLTSPPMGRLYFSICYCLDYRRGISAVCHKPVRHSKPRTDIQIERRTSYVWRRCTASGSSYGTNGMIFRCERFLYLYDVN